MTGTGTATTIQAQRLGLTSFDALQDATFASATATTRASFPEEQRLRGEDLLEFLHYKRNAVVSTTRMDLRPHSTVATYLVYAYQFWLPTVAGAVRARHARSLPYASLIIQEGEGDGHVVVLVEGTVTIVHRPAAGVLATYEARFGRSPSWVNAWLVLDPQRLLSFTDK